MAVQDDGRENEVIDLLGLEKGSERSGVDAYYKFTKDERDYVVEIELKSTTNSTVSTARDVGIEHIKKWRSKYWIIAFYDSTGKKLVSLLGLSPEEMEPWIKYIEDYICPDFKISYLAAEKLGLKDLYQVCEQKSVYSSSDAKKIHKQQWSTERYEIEKDVPKGYSEEKMLEILKLRSRYLSERGSTLNNPHITQSFLRTFSNKMITIEKLQNVKTKQEFLRQMSESWILYISKK